MKEFLIICLLFLKYVFVKPLVSIYEIICFIINYLQLYINNVNYIKQPKIIGLLYLSNSGKCTFGNSLKFKSEFTSNFVGLSKPCSILVERSAELTIGDYSGFSGVSIYCSRKIQIGSNCNFGGNVSIWDTDFHPLGFIERREHNIEKIKSLPIIIEDDVFVGANSIILKGVSIGSRSIIGAGSVVSKNIPSDEIWAGNPISKISNI